MRSLFLGVSSDGNPLVAEGYQPGADAYQSGRILCSGTIYSGIVKLQSAPGVGNHYTFEVTKNLIPTGVTATVSDLNQTANFSGSVDFNYTDIFALQVSSNLSSLPGSWIPFSWGLVFDSPIKAQPVMRGPIPYGDNKCALSSSLIDDSVSASVCGVDGQFIQLLATGGANNTFFTTTGKFGLVANGVEHLQTGFIAGTTEIVNGSVPVLRGDTVYVHETPGFQIGAPVGFNSAVLFSPDVEGYNYIPAVNIYPNVYSAGAFSIVGMVGLANVLPASCLVEGICARVPSPLGTGKVVTITLQKNGVDTGLNVGISGFAQTSNASDLNVSFVAGDLISARIALSGLARVPQLAFSVKLKVLGKMSTQAARFHLKQVGKQTQQTATFQLKNPGQPQSVQQARFKLFFPAFDQTAKSRLLALLNEGKGWDGPWNVIENGVVGPAPTGAFVPTDDPNLFAWFRSDRDLLVDASGNIVVGNAVWGDQSGFGRSLTGAAGSVPAYVAGATPSGKGAVSWPNAGSKFLDMPSTTVGEIGQPWTSFMLAKPITWTGNRYFMDGTVAPFALGAVLQNGSTPQISIYAGNFLPNTGGLTLGAWHVITGIFNGAASVLQVDNGTDTTGNVGTGVPKRIRYGNYGGGGANGAEFYLAAAIVVSGAVSATMRANHKQWLADYAGIVL